MIRLIRKVYRYSEGGRSGQEMKKACIVGYGAIGPIHAMALEKTEQGRLYAVCDIDPVRSRECAEQYGVREYNDYNNALADTEIQTVHICTPHYLHYEMIKKALAAGKDVVAEKPVTRTKKEWEELKALSGSDRVCVVLQNRLNPCVQRLRELVKDRSLGEVRAAKAVLTWNRGKSYYKSADWRGRWETEGGGLLINQAVHTLDLLSYTVGEIRGVQADMCNHTLKNSIEVEDTLAAHLEFAGGVRGVFFATNGYGENSAPFVEISFEKGAARYLDQKLWVNGKLTAEDIPAAAGKDYWGSGHERLIKRFYDEKEYFSPKDAANTMETMFALYEDAFPRYNEWVSSTVRP